MAQTINVDLKRERTKTRFNVEELTNILDNGKENTAKRREMESYILSDKNLKDEFPEEYLSHKEKYENAIRKAVLLYRKMQSYAGQALPLQESQEFSFRNSIASAIFKEISPFMLHFGMFVPAIQGQGTEEQIKKWLKRAINMEIIGTYAQTELGHGTFIRGLETTATYDAEKEEFVLNSPTLTAFKWWPGGLAHTANHCVVMAQLFTKGKNCGIQAFLVQIRDEETHMPLPGIKLGEIGAKFNFNTVNNGFLGFENHRIPRDRMLMKSAQVLKDGTFKASSNPKLVYGTMVYVRVIIVNSASSHLARAATIALRYSALRRQSKLKANEPEIQVLDYLTQQHKLFIAVATSYAYFFSARWVWRLYKNVTKDMQQGQADRLPELHVLACSLKVLSSADCSSLIERCRLACGGHGYMLSSNLPQLYAVCSAICTYEGENTVLLLQVARSLVKAWEQAHKGATLSPSMAYLSDRSPVSAWDNSVDGITRSFQKVSVGKLSEAVRCLKENSQKMSPEDAWNMTSVQLIAAAEAHARALVLSIFKMEVENSMSTASAELRGVMTSLLELYVVYWALEKTGDLLLFAKLSEADVRALQRRYERLLTEVRPNAVGLVDAYDFRDEVLNSALGAYDGNAYERLMAEAMKSPLNQEPVNQTFHKYLKPFMRGKLEPEIQVLDYLTQQHKLFIAVATSYAYFFSARWMWRLYKNVSKDMQQGQADRLPELHVLACSLKVLSSADCSSLIERCRLACGGHGYMLSSNLPQLYAVCSAICTYEGENTVLLLQVARSLVKAWEQAHKGATLSPSMAYLSDRSPVSAWDNSVDGITRSFQKVSVGKLSEAVRCLKENSQKMSPEDAWNMTSVQLIAAAEAHARALVLSIFKMEVENSMSTASAELRGVMTSLLELYVVYWALEKTGDLLLFAKLSEADVRALQRRYERLLTEVRPNAVGLVDAYDFRDEVLNSALGAYDGNAYERLMEEAMKSPLNQEPVNQTFHKYLKPFMRGKL